MILLDVDAINEVYTNTLTDLNEVRFLHLTNISDDVHRIRVPSISYIDNLPKAECVPILALLVQCSLTIDQLCLYTKENQSRHYTVS